MKAFQLIPVFFLAVCGQVSASDSAAHTAAKSSLVKSTLVSPFVGSWYMGTGSGQDCYLTINTDSTLSVQYGRCFFQGPLAHGSWVQKEDKVLLTSESPDITKRLGSYLQVVHSRGYTVLVPQANENAVLHAVDYPCEFCFWQRKKGQKGTYGLPEQAWEDNNDNYRATYQNYKAKNPGRK